MRFVSAAAFAALAVFPAFASEATVTPAPAPVTAEARGLAFVQANCARCHAIGRTDESPYAPAPPFRTLSAKYDVDGLAEAFAEGIEVGHRGEQEMPVFELTPPQIDDLVAYLNWIGG
jgi:mono/diheme cytochrome c family protein